MWIQNIEFNKVEIAIWKNNKNRVFSFFKIMWKELFDIDFNNNFEKRKVEFNKSKVYYIKNSKQIKAAAQFIKVSKGYKLSNWIIIDKDAYILWRIWVLEKYRKQWLWTKLINHWIDEIKKEWISIIYIPSEINNIDYYSKFWFTTIWKSGQIWNTIWIYMKKDI